MCLRTICRLCEKYKNQVAAVISVFVAALLVVADYQFQNISFPLFDDTVLMAWVDQCSEPKKDFFNEDSVTYVNFAKDKVLVPVTDIFGDTIGKDVITDRETILEFLELAEKSNYTYIFLDVRFEKGYETPHDSALFAQIKKMPRVVIATHRDNGGYAITDTGLLAKAAYADYRGTLFSGFTRYEFLQKGHRSVALQMLHDIDGQDIKRCKFGYKSNGKCCYNLKFIPLPRKLFKGYEEDYPDSVFMEEIRYPYAGSMILNTPFLSEEDKIHNLLDNKIIVAGDFDNDLHGTYIGEIPGPILSLAAYQYLRAGLHTVRWIYMVSLFLLYVAISFFILISGGHLSNLFENRPVTHLILSLLSLSFFFLVVKILLYRFFLISLVVFFPSIIFWVMSTFSFAVHEQKNNKKKRLKRTLWKPKTKNKNKFRL